MTIFIRCPYCRGEADEGECWFCEYGFTSVGRDDVAALVDAMSDVLLQREPDIYDTLRDEHPRLCDLIMGHFFTNYECALLRRGN
jgi:hypothetical protein